MADQNAEYPTTIGADATFKGELHFDKGARLLGRFEGQVTSKGQMVVAEGAQLSGEARAGDIRVEGQVKGNLHATGKINLAATGRLEGDIQAARLEVAEGAVLVGRCTVGVKTDGQPPAVTKAATAPAQAVTHPAPQTPDKAKGKPEPVVVKK